MRPRTTFSRKETMELLKRFLQSLALVLFMLTMLALGALGIYLFHLLGVWMARVLDDDSRPNYLHGERNSAEIFRKCVGVRVVRPTGEKKKAGSKAMEPAR